MNARFNVQKENMQEKGRFMRPFTSNYHIQTSRQGTALLMLPVRLRHHQNTIKLQFLLTQSHPAYPFA